MNLFNTITSAIFGVLLAPFGVRHDWSAWLDVVLWSVLGGIVALLVFKKISNQKGIARVKNQMKVHLLEIRLFQEDIVGVFVSTAKILAKNVLYLGYNVMPMLVMLVPMMAILVQLVATYGYKPLPPGEVALLHAQVDREVTDQPATAVRLELPPGVVLDAPPVRTPKGEAVWRLRFDQPGDQELVLRVGDRTVTKRVAVGGDARRIPVKRTKSWEGFLFPGEDGLAADAPLSSVSIEYPKRDLGWMPGGEGGILLSFFVLSLAAGFALKGVFKVTL